MMIRQLTSLLTREHVALSFRLVCKLTLGITHLAEDTGMLRFHFQHAANHSCHCGLLNMGPSGVKIIVV